MVNSDIVSSSDLRALDNSRLVRNKMMMKKMAAAYFIGIPHPYLL